MIHAMNISTIKAYAGWNQGAKAQFRSKSTGWTVAWDSVSRNAFAYGVWTAADTGGPGKTGRTGSAGFFYMMHFNAADKTDSFSMVWNDEWFSQQIGWGDACHCPASHPGATCYDPPPAAAQATDITEQQQGLTVDAEVVDEPIDHAKVAKAYGIALDAGAG
jgi:hypothetical protein